MYVRWLLTYLISVLSTIVAYLLSPLLAMCVYKELRTDVVKRFDKQIKTFDRYYLWSVFNWFQTHDNACDEYFWGVYGDSDKVTIAEYDDSILLRYWYRIAWLTRNPAYGFGHTVLGFARDDSTIQTDSTWGNFKIRVWTNANGKQAFNVKGQFFISEEYYFDINIGWKPHKTFSRLMQADRLFSWPRKV